MAANKSVTVLAPNGRRQNVKVTPNTTISQVLEEVCLKQGYNPQRYDVKHLNQVLDTNAILRFTVLPNNATLEMVPCAKERQVSNVTIGLQLENGERLMGEFPPSASLINILENLCPDQKIENAIIIYMHQEVFGKETLEATTLKTLGLTSGRAMLRLIHRNPEDLKTQAHVYCGSVGTTGKPAENRNKNKKGGKNDSGTRRGSSSVQEYLNKAISDPLSLLKSEKSKFKNLGPGHVVGRRPEEPTTIEKQLATSQDKNSPNEREASSSLDYKKKKKEATVVAAATTTTTSPQDIEFVSFLGERNALLFNQAGARALPREELPDNFFDLTVDDAKALIREAKRQREELEETPLTTAAQRQLEIDKTTLNKLHKYRRAVIRIQFPNQMVLQGLFAPLETIENVKNFIKEYLTDPNTSFVLYVTPPRKDLDEKKSLFDENLVPSAIIYYSGQSDLKPELKFKLTDPRAAGLEAIKSRVAMTRESLVEEESEEGKISEGPAASLRDTYPTEERRRIVDPVPGPSRTNSTTQSESSIQAPKWFKRFLK